MAHLILASSSPRRKELLKMITNQFEILVSDVDEQMNTIISPEQMVMELAKRKASSIAKTHQEAFVVGADTIVVSGDRILGKPNDSKEAEMMLKPLSGKTHHVYTGVAVLHQYEEELFYEKTEVTFWELTDQEIFHYISTGEPFDKAGGYGIQGFGSTLVKSIKGDFYTVVGLPVARLYKTLQNMGYSF